MPQAGLIIPISSSVDNTPRLSLSLWDASHCAKQANLQRSHFNRFLAALLGLLLLACTGCALVPDVRHEPKFINPFPQLRTIAVIPFFNQSEESTLSGERVALAYMNELQAIRGFEVLPLGAVKIKLAEFQLPGRYANAENVVDITVNPDSGYNVASATDHVVMSASDTLRFIDDNDLQQIQSGQPLASGEDFQAFARFLGVDAVLIGSITDYEFYYPPRMTLAVKWFAANPGYHPVLPGYGLPWGTKEEKKIPRWIHYEAQRALASEQLKSQSPEPSAPQPLMPEDRPLNLAPPVPDNETYSLPSDVETASSQSILDANSWENSAGSLPESWPDPRGFIPDPPANVRPEFMPQADPVISHMRNFNGHDQEFTEQLQEYFYFRDDARFGGWQAYLQRSEDFIRFCCYLHLAETLQSRGGQDESRLILRWPIDRYKR